MKTVVKYSLSLVVCCLLSCDSNLKKTSLEEAEIYENEQAPKSMRPQLKLLLKQDSNPCEVPFLLEETSAHFDPLLVESLEQRGPLETNKVRLALNLGQLSTDFGYLISFEQKEEALLYLDRCRDLAELLGITTAFDLELKEEIEENIEDSDKVARIINRETRKISKYLRSDYRTGEAVLVLTGGMIEGLYISTELLINSYNSPDVSEDCVTDILKLIKDQGFLLHGTLSMLEDLEQSDQLKNLETDLSNINDQINKLDVDNINLNNNNSWLEYVEAIREVRSNLVPKLEVI